MIALLPERMAGPSQRVLETGPLRPALVVLGLACLASAVRTAIGVPSVTRVARWVDRRLGLADRLGTALESSNEGSLMERALLEDAAIRSRAIDVAGLVPFRGVRWPAALLAVASLSLALATTWTGARIVDDRLAVTDDSFSPASVAASLTRLSELVQELADDERAPEGFQPIGRALADLAERATSGAIEPASVGAELQELLGQLARAAADSDPILAERLADLLAPSTTGTSITAEEAPFRFDAASPPVSQQPTQAPAVGEEQGQAASGFDPNEIFRTLGEVVTELEQRARQTSEEPSPQVAEAEAPQGAIGTSTYYTDRDEAREAELAARREALRQRGGAGSEVAGAATESTDEAGAMAGKGHQPLDVGAAGAEVGALEHAREEIRLDLAERPEGSRTALLPEPVARLEAAAQAITALPRPVPAGAEAVTLRDGYAFLHRDLVESYFLPDGRGGREGKTDGNGFR